jgi:hypothetical protein
VHGRQSLHLDLAALHGWHAAAALKRLAIRRALRISASSSGRARSFEGALIFACVPPYFAKITSDSLGRDDQALIEYTFTTTTKQHGDW